VISPAVGAAFRATKGTPPWVMGGFVFFLSCFALAQTPERNARARAVDALAKGRPRDAVALLEAQVEADPGAVELMDLLGRAYQRAGEAAKATETAERLLRAFPERHTTRLWLAQLLETLGRRDEAESHYGWLADAPADAPVVPADTATLARLGLARVLLAARRFVEVREVVEPLLNVNPHGEAAGLEVRSLEEEGLLDRAIETARLRMEVLPEAKMRLASLLRRRGLRAYREADLERATVELREAAFLAPEPPVLQDLATILKAAGNREEAVQTLWSVIASEGPLAPAAEVLGVLLLECGRSAEALGLAASAIERDPRARFAQILRLKALAAQGRELEAARETGRLGREHGTDSEWATAVVAALGAMEKPEAAIESWLRAVPRPPPESRAPLVHLLLKVGGRALREGDASRALDLHRQAFGLAAEDAPVRRALARAQRSLGNPGAALRVLEPLVKTAEPDTEDIEEAARALRALGRFTEGIDLVRQGLDREPKATDLRRLFWWLLQDSGREQELRNALDPEGLAQVEPRDGRVAAAILDRRCDQAPFREILAQWRARLPDEPALRRVEARALRAQGRASQARGDLAKAITLHRASLELDPRSASGHRDLFYLLREAGDSNAAIEALKEALRLEPTSLRSLALLVQTLREETRFREAREVLRQIRPPLVADAPLRLEAAQLDFAEGDFDRAATGARALAAETTDETTALAARRLQANALTRGGRFIEALSVLKDLAFAAPGDTRLLGRLARTAFHAGNEEWAMQAIEELRVRFPDEAAADTALADYFFEQGGLERARGYLRRHLALRPRDAERWSLLGEVDLRRKDPRAAREAFMAALEVSPHDGRAYQGLALAALRLGDHEEAVATCEAMLGMNPSHRPASITRLESLESRGDFVGAMHEWERAVQLFPPALDLLLSRVRLLSARGRLDEALNEARKILDGATDGSLPILLYHGITADFETNAMPAPLFRDQMRALAKAGYRTVGLGDVESWLQGKRPLPERAILITFDDARHDNLMTADGILAEFGMQAVQFVPTVLVRGLRGYHMSWSDLRRLAASGRWEFGSHGHLAHRRVRTDSAGSEGLFLVSRRWLSEESRLEGPEEMERRLEEDYRRSRETLSTEMGLEDVSAYAFPFGSFGQLDLTNEPGAFRMNLCAVRKHFRLAFYQAETAYNLRWKSPFLVRYRVPENWDGETLLAYLRKKHPLIQARLECARLLSWMGRYSESLEETTQAAALGAPEEEILHIRAGALLGKGDRPGAAAELRRLLVLDPADPRALERIEKIEREERPVASLRADAWWDGDDGYVFRQVVRGESNVLPWLRLHGEMEHATYGESGLESVDAIAGEGGALATLSGPLQIAGAFGGTWFDGSKDTPLYSSAVRYRGLDWLAIEAEAAGGAVETLRAVRDGTRLDSQSLLAAFLFTPDDRILLSYRHGFYSDGNRRNTGRWEYGRRVLTSPALRVGYDGSFDDTLMDTAAYYSPNDLHVHRAFGRLEYTPSDRFRLDARLGLGYGWEDGHGRLVGSGTVGAHWLLHRNFEISGEVSHFRNPRYWSSEVVLGLTYRF